MQILYSYLKYIYRLLDEFFLLLAVIFSECHEKPRRKDRVSEKVHRRTFVRHITFLAAHPPYIIFHCFFHLLPPFCLLQFYKEKIFFYSREWWGSSTPFLPLCVYDPVIYLLGLLTDLLKWTRLVSSVK